MLIGRADGRLVVAYNSIDDAIDKMSCMACMRYGARIPCRLYDVCRAGNKPNEDPAMFVLAMDQTIEKRCTTITKEDKNGFKRFGA